MSNMNQHNICHFFQKGTCRNGDNCPGAHVAAQNSPIAPIAPIAPTQRKICHFFQKGTCRNGTNCPGAHVAAGTLVSMSSTSAAQSQLETCRYFLKGACNKGKECKFLHTDAQNTWNPDDLEEADDSDDEVDDEIDENDAMEYDLLPDEIKDRIFMLARSDPAIQNPDQYEWKIIMRGGWRELLEKLEEIDFSANT